MLRIGGQKVPAKALFLALCDGLLVVLGLLAAVAIRFPRVPWASAYLRQADMPVRFALVGLVCGLAMYYNDMYNCQVISRRSELFRRLLQSLGVACLALALLYYISPDLGLGRGIALLAAPTIFVFMLSWRLLVDASGLLVRPSQRVLIVGTGSIGIALAREIGSRPDLGLKVIGFLDEQGENIGKSFVNPKVIGATCEVESVVEREKVERVVVSLAERRGRTPVLQLLHLKFAGVPVEDAHSFYERISGRILLDQLSPSWLFLSEGFSKSAFLVLAKRAFDLSFSSVAILLAFPIMVLVALAVWIESGSPIFFCQRRIGLGGHPFEIVKFRSMQKNAEEEGPRWAEDRDHRITRVGRFIRRYRLDELPQLFNVLRGDMSLVGPRPEQPKFCATLEREIPFFGQRHSVRPGITGWAQIKFQYGASIEEARAKLEYDLFYIKHMSPLLDLAILFETGKVILLGRGAK